MPDPELPVPELDDAAYQRALSVLLEVGTALAQELKSPTADVTVVQRATAFPNVATAIRRTIILSRHIAADPNSAAAAADPATKRTHARKHIIREVEDTIGEHADPADAAALRVELLERLDSPEFDAELSTHEPGHLIQELCRDLGLANRPFLASYTRRTPDDIAILCAQAAAAPGAGLATWLILPPPTPPRPAPS
ncbi:MAG: hypothetical protein ACRYF2_21460 [Janthinobacterium lividum]